MNLYLIGYRCTGKTRVGEALARRLGWPFVDTDRLIVEPHRVSIARMVAARGWAWFREQERQALLAVAAQARQVVATGGGIVLDPRNGVLMKRSGRVIWLRATAATIAQRMQADDASVDQRPTLTGRGALAEIAPVMAQRAPLYGEAAHLVIDTDRHGIEAIVQRIVEEMGLDTP